jgi:hypothetical protein
MKPGRKKENTTFIDRSVFDEVMKSRGYSIRMLGRENGYLRDSTIRRGLKHGFSDEILDRLAIKLDIDPEWLTGLPQKKYERLFKDRIDEKKYKSLTDWRRHPYNRAAIERKKIPFSDFARNLVLRLGVNDNSYDNLLDYEKQEIEDTLATLAYAVIIKAFHNSPDSLDLGVALLADDLLPSVDKLLGLEEYERIKEAFEFNPY